MRTWRHRHALVFCPTRRCFLRCSRTRGAGPRIPRASGRPAAPNWGKPAPVPAPLGNEGQRPGASRHRFVDWHRFVVDAGRSLFLHRSRHNSGPSSAPSWPGAARPASGGSRRRATRTRGLPAAAGPGGHGYARGSQPAGRGPAAPVCRAWRVSAETDRQAVATACCGLPAALGEDGGVKRRRPACSAVIEGRDQGA